MATKKKAKYFKREDGLYETIKRVNGKRVAFRGRTCAEIDKKILEYNAELKMGRKFPEIADEWYESIERACSVSSYRTYRYAVDRLKTAFVGRAKEVRPLDVERYLRAFEAKGYAANTVQIELYVLKAIFSHAVLQGDVDVNPAVAVKKSKRLPFKKRTALTEEQELRVEAYRGEHWLLGLMLLYTGCRRGELLALNWQDIDREAGTIRVNKKLNYAYGNTPHLDNFLKNRNAENNDGCERIVPLLAPLAAALPKNRIGRIFTNERGEYYTNTQLSTVWRTYCRGVGLTEWTYNEAGELVETFPITPHCFRHSFTTICYEAGIDAKTAASYIGDTEQVASKIYTDLRNSKRASSVDMVNAYLAMRAEERMVK